MAINTKKNKKKAIEPHKRVYELGQVNSINWLTSFALQFGLEYEKYEDEASQASALQNMDNAAKLFRIHPNYMLQ